MKTYNEIKLAQELIRFPTIKTEDKGIMKFLSKKLTAIGFKCYNNKIKRNWIKTSSQSICKIW